MNRRNFLQQFIITLLTLLFGPKVVAAMTAEQFDEVTDWAQRHPGFFTIVAVDKNTGVITLDDSSELTVGGGDYLFRRGDVVSVDR